MIKGKTGLLFHKLWKELSSKQFDHSVSLLNNRIKKNKFSKKNFKNKVILDVGCGSGRWSKLCYDLGAKKVIGLDSSRENIKFLQKKFPYISFKYGDSISLPFKNNLFDISISWGVAHHTLDINKSLNELIRVTKKGGKILLLLYGEGGLRWSLIKKLRPIVNFLGEKKIKSYMVESNFPENRIKHFTDDLFVPILYQIGLNTVKEIFKGKITSIKEWSKIKTYDHEENFELYLKEVYYLKTIFKKVENKILRNVSIKMIENKIQEMKLIENSKLKRKQKDAIIFGEKNHRLVITK